MKDFFRPSVSQNIPHTIPPAVHPKIKIEFMVALMLSAFCLPELCRRSLTASGRYTDINVDTVPPNRLLKKQIRNNGRLYFRKATDFVKEISADPFMFYYLY